jgi:hypothetical protein
MSKIQQILLALTVAFLTGSGSFRVGKYTVQAKLNGAPVKLTFEQALAAIAEIEAGATADFQVGSVEITITE